MGMNIAIDGPAGAGKSTIARRVAASLSYVYVDTGAMYRAIALYFLRGGIAPEDTDGIAAGCTGAQISIRYQDGEQQVLLNGENVTEELRREEVGNMASVVSAVGEVRAHLLHLQRELARTYDVVMDGRDIGTTILPKAQVKIFLTASADERARRRCHQLEQKGEAADFEAIRADIVDRDRRDMEREVSPLRQAEDAVLLDSTHMDIQEVCDAILTIAKERA